VKGALLDHSLRTQSKFTADRVNRPSSRAAANKLCVEHGAKVLSRTLGLGSRGLKNEISTEDTPSAARPQGRGRNEHQQRAKGGLAKGRSRQVVHLAEIGTRGSREEAQRNELTGGLLHIITATN